MYENFELLANAIILQAVRDYRYTYLPQVRAEIKRFFRSEWFRALTRVDGEMIIARLENERTENYEYPKTKSLLFTMQIQRSKKTIYSKRFAAVMFVYFSAQPQKWVPERMCKNCFMPRTTLIVRGVRQIWSSVPGELYGRAIRTKRCIFIAM